MSFFSFQFPRVECVKLSDRFCVRLAALFIGWEFWLWGRPKKNYAEIKICPEGHLQSRAAQTKEPRPEKKVNFVVSNKKCKCCESVKRTMGKWGRTKQNKTVKERKIKWNESRVEILPDLPVSFEYSSRRSLKRLWRFAREDFWLD